MSGRRTTSRRGLALVELLLGITITSIIGLAIATVLISVATGMTHSREARSALQRAFAAHSRLQAYFDPGLCILDEQPKTGFAIWLHDGRANGMVNLLELRVFHFNIAEQTIDVEWVAFPEEWDEASITAADVLVPTGSDYFQVIAAQRALGYTESVTLADEIGDVAMSYDTVSVTDAERFRVTLTLMLNEEDSNDVLFALGLPNHLLPG